MEANRILNGNARLIVVAVSAAIILFPLGYSVVTSAFLEGAPLPEDPDGEYCLDEGDVPRTYMRFHHMDLLKDLRDEMVRDGKGKVEFFGKTRQVEIDGCWKCHSSRREFCNRCHGPVNLYPDCFRCHYCPDYPD